MPYVVLAATVLMLSDGVLYCLEQVEKVRQEEIRSKKYSVPLGVVA